MIPGKLYKCPKYFLLFYPSKDKAADSLRVAVARAARMGATAVHEAAIGPASSVADWWSRKLNCKVRYSEPNEVFLCLEHEDEFAHVLFGEKQGWIINQDWLNIVGLKKVCNEKM